MSEQVTYAPFGLTTEQYAEAQQAFTDYARSRIYLGKLEYDLATHQKVEVQSLDELVTQLREELADAVNYLTAIDIKLERILNTQIAQALRQTND